MAGTDLALLNQSRKSFPDPFPMTGFASAHWFEMKSGGATTYPVGGQEPVSIGKGTIVGCPVLMANGSPIPSLVAMEPLQEHLWRHELEGGWGGNDSAEWKWRIHRHFYHPAMNQ